MSLHVADVGGVMENNALLPSCRCITCSSTSNKGVCRISRGLASCYWHYHVDTPRAAGAITIGTHARSWLNNTDTCWSNRFVRSVQGWWKNLLMQETVAKDAEDGCYGRYHIWVCQDHIWGLSGVGKGWVAFLIALGWRGITCWFIRMASGFGTQNWYKSC